MFRAIGKFFKKVGGGLWKGIKAVGKTVKRVAPYAMFAAAAFFTAGAAMGLGGIFAGGWGGAVSAAISKLGLSGTIANVLGGAVAMGGYSALGGGALGALTGGAEGFHRGVGSGAKWGAVAGGVMGGFGVGPGLQAAGTESVGAHGVPDTPIGTGGGLSGAGSGAGTGVGLKEGLSAVFGKGGFMERNAGLLGPMLQGIGGAIVGNSQYQSMQQRSQNYDIDFDKLGDRFDFGGGGGAPPAPGGGGLGAAGPPALPRPASPRPAESTDRMGLQAAARNIVAPYMSDPNVNPTY